MAQLTGWTVHAETLPAIATFGTFLIIFAYIRFIGIKEPKALDAPVDAEALVTTEEKWSELFAIAERVVSDVIPTLPKPVEAEARKVQCLFERWPPDEYARETLGLYLGAFDPGKVSVAPGPIQIFIGGHYLRAVNGETDFAEDVRVTYLHELGHHLGLDEGEMEERGLL